MACGAVFDASIIKHYKGKKGRFSFFSTNMWFFDGFERQYLVIANSPDLAAAPRPKFEEPPSESDRAFDECTSGAAANNVGSDHQAAFPLIVDTKTGDRALKLSLEYPMASFVALDTFRFQVVGNETCERQFILMSWTDVERAIIEALEPR